MWSRSSKGLLTILESVIWLRGFSKRDVAYVRLSRLGEPSATQDATSPMLAPIHFRRWRFPPAPLLMRSQYPRDRSRLANARAAELLRVGLRLEPDRAVRRFGCRQVVVSKLSGQQSADKTIKTSTVYPTVTNGIARRHHQFQI